MALVLFVLWLMIRGAFKAFPFVAKFVDLVHTLVGDESNPGIGSRMDAQTKQLAQIMHEVLPNHGSSLNDSVRRTEQALEDHLKIADKQDQEQKETAKRLEEHIVETKEYGPWIEDVHDHDIEEGKKEQKSERT